MPRKPIQTFGKQLSEEEASTTDTTPKEEDIELFVQTRKASAVATSQPKIKQLVFGSQSTQTWFSAPFPAEYITQKGTLWICEFCLSYFSSELTMSRHAVKCSIRHPPGNQIYDDQKIQVFEVNGTDEKGYCQNLCLISKLFLDHKTLYYDVEPFLFYVFTERDDSGFHIVGYFSKEKNASCPFNLSCILVLPFHQRKGYGSFIIDFSYLLSTEEKRVGTPEKPLSDLGLKGYKSFWKIKVLEFFQEADRSEIDSCSIADISRKTGMSVDDVIIAFEDLGLVSRQNSVAINRKMFNLKPRLRPDIKFLRWTPMLHFVIPE